MVKRLKSILNCVLCLGIQEECNKPQGDIRKIKITNALSVLLICASLFFTLFYYQVGLKFSAALILIAFFSFIIVLFLNSQKKTTSAKILLLLTFNTIAFLDNLALNGLIVNIFFGIVIVPIYLFSYTKEKWALIFFIVLPALLQIFSSGFEFVLYAHTQQISQQMITIVPILINVISFLVIIVATFLYLRETEAHEELLVERNEELSRFQEVEKMAMLGKLMAGISHEIKNPLHFIMNYTVVIKEIVANLKNKNLLNQSEYDDLEFAVQTISKNSQRAGDTVNSMLLHFRRPGTDLEKIDINKQIQTTLQLYRQGMKTEKNKLQGKVDIREKLSSNLPAVSGITQNFNRIILNLVDNAYDALSDKFIKDQTSSEKPFIEISTALEENSVVVRIVDNGSGIEAEVLDEIFTPFFTTKPAGSGTGLGLSLLKETMTSEFGGEVKVESEKGKGTTFTLYFPV